MSDFTPSNPSRTTAFGPIARGWKWLLILSLAGNLVILGMIGGALIKAPFHDGPPRNLGFGPYTAALSPEDRKSLMREMRARSPQSGSPHERMRRDREELSRLLTAPQYDAAAVAALLELQRVRADDRFRLGQSLILERIGGLSAEERRAMAERLQHRD